MSKKVLFGQKGTISQYVIKSITTFETWGGESKLIHDQDWESRGILVFHSFTGNCWKWDKLSGRAGFLYQPPPPLTMFIASSLLLQMWVQCIVCSDVVVARELNNDGRYIIHCTLRHSVFVQLNCTMWLHYMCVHIHIKFDCVKWPVGCSVWKCQNKPLCFRVSEVQTSLAVIGNMFGRNVSKYFQIQSICLLA